jgi:predicted nucleic acid-binding protein
MRIFLDANVVFSAAASGGNVSVLVDLLLAHGHECWADAYVLAEARRNLATKRPADLAALDRLIGRIRLAAPADPAGAAIFSEEVLPAKDRPVLAAAIGSGCDALVTGDRARALRQALRPDHCWGDDLLAAFVGRGALSGMRAAPAEILKALGQLEAEIQQGMKELEGMLK